MQEGVYIADLNLKVCDARLRREGPSAFVALLGPFVGQVQSCVASPMVDSEWHYGRCAELAVRVVGTRIITLVPPRTSLEDPCNHIDIR